MNEKETLQAASDTLTEAPVTLDITIASRGRMHAWLQKIKLMPRKRSFLVRPATLGTLARISKLLLSIEVDDLSQEQFLNSSYLLASAHHRTIAEVLAVAVTNTREYPGEKLIDFLLHHLTARELLFCTSLLLKQMDLSNFIYSIISIKGLSVLQGAGKKNVKNEVSPQETAR